MDNISSVTNTSLINAFGIKKCYKMYFIFFIVATSILIYFYYLKYRYGKDFVQHDFMNRKVANIPYLEN